MKKIFTLLILLMMLPVTALTAETNTVYVGGMALAGSSEDTVYATTNENGEVITNDADANNYNIKWDGSTLTLHDATIQKELYASDLLLSNIAGAAIGVINQSGDAGLTVQLEGNNKIEGVSTGIHVRSSGGNAALNITGNGTLVVNSNYLTIQVTSIGGNAALSIENAKVTATSSYSNVVTVQSGNSENSSASLTVDGGSLTATAPSNNVSGIRFVFGSGGSGSGTPNLTVSGNATVRANGSAGGITNNSSTGVQYGTGSSTTGGIVFDGKNGTVYGNVELQENLEIGEGESLTIPDGSSLNCNDNLTNDGTIIVEKGGNLEGTPTGEGMVVSAPKITTESLPDGTVGTAYSQTLAADNNPTEWTVTVGSLPDGLTLNQITGEISGTPTTASESKFTVTATNTAGSDSKEYKLTIKSVSVTDVKLDKTELSLYTGESATLNATVEPGNATNKNVTWNSDNPEVATVEDGKVTAVAEGEATITVTTEDGSNTAICKVKVTQSTYSITSDIMALDFGSAYIGYTQPTAQTVTITNTGNRPLTLDQPASTTFEVGTLSTTDLSAGETATFTVQPKADLKAWTYKEEIVVSGSNQVTLMISATFNVRNQVEVEPSGSTNISLTTDQDEFTLTATVQVNGDFLNPTDGSWKWSVANVDIVALSGSPTLRSVSVSSSIQAFEIKSPGTTTITATYDDGTYRGSIVFTVTVEIPPVVITYHDLYITESTGAKLVSRYDKTSTPDGGSFTLSLEKEEGYEDCEPTVYYKRGRFGEWKELKLDEVSGYYQIRSVYTDIYVKVSGDGIWPVSNEEIEAQEVKVYVQNGAIVVVTPSIMDVQVVSMTGAQVAADKVAGQREFRNLAEGVYVVRVGEVIVKVRL